MATKKQPVKKAATKKVAAKTVITRKQATAFVTAEKKAAAKKVTSEKTKNSTVIKKIVKFTIDTKTKSATCATNFNVTLTDLRNVQEILECWINDKFGKSIAEHLKDFEKELAKKSAAKRAASKKVAKK